MSNEVKHINEIKLTNDMKQNNKFNDGAKSPPSPAKVKKEIAISACAKEIDHRRFMRDRTPLKVFKLDELKYIAKKHALKFSGTKPVLIERITDHFKHTYYVTKIQARFRGWIIKLSFKLRGPALKNRKKCVNDCDFVTLEPIDEIPIESFYSYEDGKQFTYGFNIGSLIQVLKMKGKLYNPYNRETIDGQHVIDILRLYSFCFTIYPEFKLENNRFASPNQRSLRTPALVNRHINAMTTNEITNALNNIGLLEEAFHQNDIFANYNPQVHNSVVLTNEQRDRLARLREIRRMTLAQRVNNLFVELDHLGNYTQASWFNLLEPRDYNILYRSLYDIWYYRGDLDPATRFHICPFLTPFYNINNNARNPRTDLGPDGLKKLCLIIFENLVYTGTDDEYRKIGALHALSALTLVSVGARIAMPWLYESVIYA